MPPRGLRCDGAFDIECANWDRLVVGALYSPLTGSRIVRSPDALADALLGAGGTWWAWCGGRYDFLQIADVLHRRRASAVAYTSGGAVSRIVCGDLTLCDAWFLCPMRLDEARSIAGIPERGRLPWPCICDQAAGEPECEGYCQVTSAMPAERVRALAEWCSSDARATYEVIAALMRHADAHGYQLRGTIGGTAWETARAALGLPPASYRSSVWRKVRAAYYGGRVLVGRARAQHGYAWDVSSAYPAALARTPLPVGDHAEVDRHVAARAWDRERPGVYRATVRVPDLFVPPLPWRADERVAYPTGQITGSWTQPELAAAVERGVAVEQLHGAILWESSAVLFDGLVGDWYSVRARAGKRSGIGKWQRLLANALTGKFAQGPVSESVALHPRRVRYCDPASERARRAGCRPGRCTRECLAYRQLDQWGTIWAVPRWRQSEASHVIWAAYLTAANRAHVLSALDRASADLVYSDTDSVWRRVPDVEAAQTGQLELARDQAAYTPESLAPGVVGEGLGQYEWRGEFYDWRCIRQKAYRYRDERGEVVCRTAGMPRLTDRQWEELTSGHRAMVSDRGVLSLREAAIASGGLFRRRYRPMAPLILDGFYGDRLLAEDGRTYPMAREEIEEHRKERRRQGQEGATR